MSWRAIAIGIASAGSACNGSFSANAQSAITDPALVVSICVRLVHGSPHSPAYPDYANKNFDAYYDRQSNKVFNNARMNVDQEALYIFGKCLSERGLSFNPE